MPFFGEVILTKRRYTEFAALYQLLCMQKPGNIIPWIPEKSLSANLAESNSSEILLRREDFQKFLQ